MQTKEEIMKEVESKGFDTERQMQTHIMSKILEVLCDIRDGRKIIWKPNTKEKE